jgi:hypothetical protein
MYHGMYHSAIIRSACTGRLCFSCASPLRQGANVTIVTVHCEVGTELCYVTSVFSKWGLLVRGCDEVKVGVAQENPITVGK